MIASTEQIDDIEAAVREIKAQLDSQKPLKNTIGIIACHYEFVLSGVVKALGEALPFDTAGTITSVGTVNNTAGTLLLTLMVLTSDDVRFETALSSSLRGDPEKAIMETYAGAETAFPGERPALLFAFAPFMLENSGDKYVEALTRASGGIPCFGTLAVDDTPDFRECYMLYRGEYYRDRMSMILVYGAVNPKFFLATISENKILDKAALITSSEGHILKEINHRPVVEYFESMGLTKASETSYAMTSLPFMLDYGDGTPPVSKVFIGLNENKHAICAGAMPEGSTLYLGVFDKEDVLLTTGEALEAAFRETPHPSGILIYSCVSRLMSLGSDLLAESKMIKEKAAGKAPLLMAYSGGEICPTLINEQTAINRFHNNTVIICIF
ncbi:MAG: FIST C-terminal domain-containing protein [Spirochaetaceae bacterium]|nr:FIST C-terminal domain-containing protein [Spirochaetaceae bacterium]